MRLIIMILDIDKINLELVRGDTFKLPLPLNCGTREEFVPYFLQHNDFLYVGIMRPGQAFEDAEIRTALNYTSRTDAFGNPLLYISAEASCLVEPGKYYLSIKFKSNDEVTTLVDHKIFYVLGSHHCC